MRTPEEAISEILKRVEPLGETEAVELLGALGRVLAVDVVSDVDLPPFRKSAMDGFAVRSAEFEKDEERLHVVGESRAGTPFEGAIPVGSCIAIYTGAELPESCDAVIPIEKTNPDGARVVFHETPRVGQNICNRGEDLARGETVMLPGRRLSATDLSVLAAVGSDPVRVFRRPRVAILTTGDELVPPSAVPGRGQIREGNTLHLAALTQRAGSEVVEVGIVADRIEAHAERFGAALEKSDAVITTGGVSMGKYDLVADVFRELGVEEVFHKVAIKPGKPMWFGMQGKKPVFALPGNPVSCLLDHEVFVRPALQKLESADPVGWQVRRRIGRWSGGSVRANPRQQNVPVRVTFGADGVDRLEPLAWRSSADIVGLSQADGMAVIAAGETLESDQLVSYRPLRGAW